MAVENFKIITVKFIFHGYFHICEIRSELKIGMTKYHINISNVFKRHHFISVLDLYCAF